MDQQQRRRDVVLAHLEEHVDTPSRTIANYLFERYPNLWDTHNAVLNSVRYYRRSAGKTSRKRREGRREYPHIPMPDKGRKADVHLKTTGKWLVIGDAHIPYHDKKALELAVNYAVDRGVEHVLFNGDMLDAHQQSHWVRDPNKRSTDSEIEKAAKILQSIGNCFPGRKVYKVGNHEARIENYLFTHAPRMIGMSKWDLCKQLAEAYELDGDDSWTWVDSKQFYWLGKLEGYHGHELPKGLTNPVSVGRGLFLRAHSSAFTNHWHQTSHHVETDSRKRKTWVCFSIGCLCDLHPEYAPVNRWNHGFAIVDIKRNGGYNEENKRIHKGDIQ